MHYKDIIFGKEARASMLKGINTLSDAVCCTLGPQGQTVLIDRDYQAPRITKDGVSVAKEIFLKDKWENIGAQLVRDVATKTNEISGDGTTTATCLAAALYEEGLKYLEENEESSVKLKKDIEELLESSLEKLKEYRKFITIDDAHAIAKISSNGDEKISNLVVNAIREVGVDGHIHLQESTRWDDHWEKVPGIQFNKGYASPLFINEPAKMRAVWHKPLFLFVNGVVDRVESFLEVFQEITNRESKNEKFFGRPLIFIAEEIKGDVLNVFLMNRLNNAFSGCCIQRPLHGDQALEVIEDLAIFTGATVIDGEQIKYNESRATHLGSAEKIIIEADKTTIIGGNFDQTRFDERLQYLNERYESETNEEAKEFIKHRRLKLEGRIGIIQVGGKTELDMKERYDRIEDALQATKAALEEGIVPGGGVALKDVANSLIEEEEIVHKYNKEIYVLYRALMAPFERIHQNCGIDPIHIDTMIGEGIGLNGVTQDYGNMIDMNIIDPYKVVATALSNAVYATGLLLTTNVLLADVRTGGDELVPVHSMKIG